MRKKILDEIKMRKAEITDVKKIQTLIGRFALKNEMLPRSLNDLLECLRDFVVVEDKLGEVIGCGALHITWFDIAEVRSLAVDKKYQGFGIGKIIIEFLIIEAELFGLKKVFALTYKPEFFKKMGFSIITKDDLPKKVWTDCIKCPKFPDCDEIAVQLELKTNIRKANKI